MIINRVITYSAGCLMLMCSSLSILHAQNIHLDPPDVSIEGDPTVIVTPTMQISNTGTLQIMRWKRTINDLPEGWTSTVMDPLIHWTAETDMSTIGFPLPPDSNETVWVHFDARNFHDGIFEPVPGCGLVELTFFSETDSANYNAVGVFRAYLGATPEDCAVDVFSSEAENNYLIYPNPANAACSILASRNAGIEVVNIINMNGQIAMRTDWDGSSGRNKIDISALPEGIYAVQLLDSTAINRFSGNLVVVH